MTPEEIDEILARNAPPDAGSAAIQRAKASLPSLQLVRPLASPWAFALAFITVFAAVSALGAWALGVGGLPLLSGFQRAVIFPVLFVGGIIAAMASVREMRPAGGTRIGSLALAIGTLAPLAAFALLFSDYGDARFVAEGVNCLLAGVVCAIPAALAIYLLLRRGFVLDWRAAGLAIGTLAGLAGIGMLELHCPILKAPHLMFWHVAVVWVCGIGGCLAGWMYMRAARNRVTGP